jgi:hypothetical protein
MLFLQVLATIYCGTDKECDHIPGEERVLLSITVTSISTLKLEYFSLALTRYI